MYLLGYITYQVIPSSWQYRLISKINQGMKQCKVGQVLENVRVPYAVLMFSHLRQI
jgi:hypothetical protein